MNRGSILEKKQHFEFWKNHVHESLNAKVTIA